MPEGPTIFILKEEAEQFTGKKVIEVSGNSKQPIQRIKNQKIIEFKTWGKHFLICFKKFTVKIHFMLFGSYKINERKEAKPRLSLMFEDGEFNFYACSVKFIDEPLSEIYDWSVDVLSDLWDPKAAKAKIKEHPERPVTDVLLDQHIFSGVGNIIKNEVLFRTRIHPLTAVGDLPVKKLNEMIREARNYSFDFLKWKKKYELKKHYLIYNKSICTNCGNKITRKHLGKTNRRTFYCEHCQKQYS